MTQRVNLQNFSDVILPGNEAQMKPASGAYVLVRERARRNCNDVSGQKNELKIVKDKVRRFYKGLPCRKTSVYIKSGIILPAALTTIHCRRNVQSLYIVVALYLKLLLICAYGV
jgi:hypothetical protein